MLVQRQTIKPRWNSQSLTCCIRVFGINKHIYIMIHLKLMSVNNFLSLDSRISFDRDATADQTQCVISPDLVSGRTEIDKYINEGDSWKRDSQSFNTLLNMITCSVRCCLRVCICCPQVAEREPAVLNSSFRNSSHHLLNEES